MILGRGGPGRAVCEKPRRATRASNKSRRRNTGNGWSSIAAARSINRRGRLNIWRPTRAPPVLGIKMFPVATRSKRGSDGGLGGPLLMIHKAPVKSERDERNSRSGAMRASGALGPLQSGLDHGSPTSTY